jgi:hypothetical protein
MASFEDAARIALALPGTARVKDTFKVRGRSFVAVYPERIDPKKGRVPNYGAVLLWVADLGDKEAYLQGEPGKFFTTDHYDGYPAVLLWLERVDVAELEGLIREAWTVRAPKELLGEV